jgi:hypothetical protein
MTQGDTKPDAFSFHFEREPIQPFCSSRRQNTIAGRLANPDKS